jgi:cytidine deaminase
MGAPTAEQIDAMFRAALDAQREAYAPYSQFHVGAAVLVPDGRIFAAGNVENAAYPEGTCAETGAIAMMAAAGVREIAAVLTVCPGEALGTCCGGCRQRIREFAEPDTPVYAAGPEGIRATFRLDELLPSSFGPDHLRQPGGGGGTP